MDRDQIDDNLERSPYQSKLSHSIPVTDSIESMEMATTQIPASDASNASNASDMDQSHHHIDPVNDNIIDDVVNTVLIKETVSFR